ncbi:uncharacterized protein LOC135472382 [Liolophura sinensis]|uniref:uncharacterized protein LOC135472382 n=1 Tax=Liolophura sinensis TaxID=3198878 RepID=UPI003159909D
MSAEMPRKLSVITITCAREMAMCSMGIGNFRKLAVAYLQDTLLNLHNVKVKLDCKENKFKSERELPSVTSVNMSSIRALVDQRLKLIFPGENSKAAIFSDNCYNILNAERCENIFKTLLRLSARVDEIVKEWGVAEELFVGVVPQPNDYSLVEVELDNTINRITLKWNKNTLAADIVTAVSKLAEKLRHQKRQPTPAEYLAFQLAYCNINKGKSMNHEGFRGLGTPGFRPHTQTYMSLTDPGDGHVLGTTRFEDWMKGAIVHVEHLERPNHLPRENIESYRIPSLYDFTKVRLHVGPTAPTTYFVGRRVKDSGSFDEDFLKLVNITAASASAAFNQGAAECKVAMEGLSTSQAVRYMQALRGQVQRSRKQFLSAAWNLNQTVLDDYKQEAPINLEERMDIATRAIEITSIGGFDKVTWDGASDTYPSKCIMYQLSFEEALTLVHEAHLRGLVTYFSAGFKFGEIKHAVYAGVDGIGIGGAQVLRFMDSETGMHGPYTEENIPRILANRDEAANSVRGRGVHLLARLDTMFFEGSITSDQNILRYELYTALLTRNESRLKALMAELSEVISLPDEGNSPITHVAKRLIESKSPLLSQQAESPEQWETFVETLTCLVDDQDEEELVEEYENEPWMTFRKKYREWQLKSHRRVTRQNSFTTQYKVYSA